MVYSVAFYYGTIQKKLYTEIIVEQVSKTIVMLIAVMRIEKHMETVGIYVYVHG